jgi:hypothetical protein
MPSERDARKVQDTIENLKKLRKIYSGVKLDMKDIEWIRVQFRKMGTGRPKPIPQRISLMSVKSWAENRDLTIEEFAAIALLAPSVFRAKILSEPAQCWIEAIMRGIEVQFEENPFSVYLERYSNRAGAVAALADAVFFALIKEVGREKLNQYIGAMAITGESYFAEKYYGDNSH